MTLWEQLSADPATIFWTIAVGAVSNIACAIMGTFLLLRRMCLLGDAISHAVLPGIVIAFLLTGQIASGPMFIGALILGITTAVLTQTLHTLGKVPEDASMGVVFTSLFAVGVVLINRGGDVDLDPGCVLYGLIEGVPLNTVLLGGWEIPRAMFTLTGVLLVTLLFVTLFWKELKISSFDPMLATSMGISALLMHYLIMAMVATVTVAAFESVGSILVVAMLIVPAAAAHLLTDRLLTTVVLAAGIGALSSLLGCLFAMMLNTSVAGMMAVSAGGLFTCSLLLAPRHGLVSKAWHRWLLAVRIASEDIIAGLYRLEEERGKGVILDHKAACLLASGRLAARRGLARLALRNEVELVDKTVQLTVAGRQLAKSLVRSHRLWESFLGENFDLPLDHLHEPAEQIEHFIGPQLQEELASLLETPKQDPHGRDIPPG